MNIDKSTVKRLAIQHEGEIPLFGAVYKFTDEQLQAFSNAIIKAYASEKKPVAWTITNPDGVTVDEVPDYAFYSERDAVEHRDEHCYETCNVVPLYTSPQTREWVGVSDEAIFEMCPYIDHDLLEEAFYRGARAIEAKLRELNEVKE